MHVSSIVLPCFSLIVSLLCASSLSAQLAAPVLPSRENLKPVVPQHSLPEDIGSGHASIVLTGPFLNELISSQIIDEGPVRDFVLGAEVIGSQRTIAASSLQLIPSNGQARLVINLNGTTTNLTTNYTQRAAIKSVGTYHFQMAKQIAFDGSVVSTWAPSAVLTADQQNVAAATRLAPVPILGPLTTRTAINVANRRTPVAEQIAAAKVTQKVAPKFNNEVDAKLTEINQFLHGNFKQLLEKYQLEATQFSAYTTENQLVLSASTRASSLIMNSSVPMAAKSDLSIILDDALLNRLIQKLPLAGLRIPDRHLKAVISGEAKTLTSSATPEFISIVFDDVQPLKINFENGAIHLEARLAIQPVLGAQRPLHRFVISLTPSLQGDSVQLIPALVNVEEVGGESGKTASGITLEAIRAQLSNDLTPRLYPRKIDLTPVSSPLLQQAGLNTALMTAVHVQSGKLIVEFDLSPNSNLIPVR
ncbi:hypothetical protein Mal48_42710 [Thalassoglobus polymorphus]|uniref:DUF4403 family protein n=1 Tax=Thalassoglobus polymorphus TaxID=2527994 RepID=A0A517QTU2_9PLAN|nr:hypothetical protein Mal48_42710 [Thalassoglobus polymorphus]